MGKSFKCVPEKLPIGAGNKPDYERGYRELLKVLEQANDRITWLVQLLAWCRPRLKNEMCMRSLDNMRNDPTHQVPRDTKPETVRQEPGVRGMTAVELATFVDELPPETVRFLLDVDPENIPLTNENHDHMKRLRKLGMLVLEGSDNRLSVPLRFTKVGQAARNLVFRRATA